MSNACTTPAGPADMRYVYGADCTWHGPIAMAGATADGTPCCPVSGGPLLELPSEEAFWAEASANNRANPMAEPMLRWSRLRCFPDADTLENAYRQAMEGTE